VHKGQIPFLRSSSVVDMYTVNIHRGADSLSVSNTEPPAYEPEPRAVDWSSYNLVSSTSLKDGRAKEDVAKIFVACEKGYGLLINEIAALRPGRAMLLNGCSNLSPALPCRARRTCSSGDKRLYLSCLSTGMEAQTSTHTPHPQHRLQQGSNACQRMRMQILRDAVFALL